MPIERTPKSRALAVIIEILEPAKKNRVDVRDAATSNSRPILFKRGS
jgi:hypothetical protein